jgi:hypothetical protein
MLISLIATTSLHREASHKAKVQNQTGRRFGKKRRPVCNAVLSS